ncbi:3-demethylubiquinone-9 3-O-methyltransferase [Oculatella sp. LEGE 06141]|nr:3-demethylubiquinone-9 3-O-methyltransferase [Oculatella sp. LEGE 06141]
MKKNDLEFYDLSAEQWWNQDSKIYALHHLNKPRFEFFDRYVSDWQNLNVLDVGCGGGFSCEFMAARQAVVSGMDQSQKCIDAAQKHAATNGFAINYCCAMAEEMPYADHTFDVVVCVDVLEHVENVYCVLSEISRILKPNGLFFFDTINRNFKSKLVMIWLMENILGEIQKGVHDWNKFITLDELHELLHKTGFGQVDIKGFDLFGDAFRLNLASYLNYKKTGLPNVAINDDTSINYIGKATKRMLEP